MGAAVRVDVRVEFGKKPLMLVGMPSSGSDWLVSCLMRSRAALIGPTAEWWRIRECGGDGPHPKEFFNPLCNSQHEVALRELFGCEAADSYLNIAAPVNGGRVAAFGKLLDGIWQPEWNFTKEVWLGFQAGLLFDRFDCIALVRSERHTFPPSRLRVWQWYGAIHDSLVHHGRLPAAASTATIRQKATLAHAKLYAEMSASFGRVVRYEDLISDSPTRVAAALAPFAPHCDVDRLAGQVLGTARQRPFD